MTHVLCERRIRCLGTVVLVLLVASVGASGCARAKPSAPGEDTRPLSKVLSVLSDLLQPAEEATEEEAIRGELRVLFEDDFSACGTWVEYDDAASASQCGSGVLALSVNVPEYTTWSLSGQRYGDCALEVDAIHREGPTDSSYGLIFQYADPANFYEFDVSSNGLYTLGKFVNDEWKPLINWTTDARIHQRARRNRLRVSIQGHDIVLFINGSRIVTYSDTAIGSNIGSVGVIVNTYEQGNTVVQFDNFRVMEAVE